MLEKITNVKLNCEKWQLLSSWCNKILRPDACMALTILGDDSRLLLVVLLQNPTTTVSVKFLSICFDEITKVFIVMYLYKETKSNYISV